MKKTLIILTIGLGMFSCEKNQGIETITSSNNDENSVTEVLARESANTSGMDYLGEFHNDGLDRVAEEPNVSSLSYEDKYNILKAFSDETFGVTTVSSLSELDISINLLKDITEIAQEQFENGKISLEAKQEMENLRSHLFSYVNISQLDDLHDELMDFEDRIHGSVNLTVAEKKQLIGTSIIARYSSSYWVNALNDNSHPWHNVVVAYDIDGMFLPTSIVVDYIGDGTGLAQRLPISFWVDIIAFDNWAADCPGNDFGTDATCYEMAAFNASIASSY